MKQVVFCFALLLASFSFAQQQGQPPPSSQPPYGTPPTFPVGRQTPEQQMPPDQEAPPPGALSTRPGEGQIFHHLSTEPGLANTNVDAKVDDNSVVLTGNVDTEIQHELALRIAQSYAGNRKIVDKVKLRKQT
jgi:hypothetical protein